MTASRDAAAPVRKFLSMTIRAPRGARTAKSNSNRLPTGRLAFSARPAIAQVVPRWNATAVLGMSCRGVRAPDRDSAAKRNLEFMVSLRDAGSTASSGARVGS
jgi:hypothetical protein